MIAWDLTLRFWIPAVGQSSLTIASRGKANAAAAVDDSRLG